MLNENTKKKYYEFLIGLFKFDSQLQKLPINFSQYWWQPFLDQKKLTISVVVNTILESVFTTITPILIAWAYNTQNYLNLTYVFSLWLVINLVRFFTYKMELMLVGNIMYSVNIAANRFFLEVDPIFHTKRESGKIIAKADRGIQAYNDLIDSLLINLIPFFTRVITITISLSSYNFILGAVSLTSLLFIIALNIIFTTFNSKIFLEYNIEILDNQKAIEIQNLNLVSYIRSVFGTKSQLEKLDKINRKATGAELTQYQAYFGIILTIRILYLLSTFIIAYVCLVQSQTGTISFATGVSLVATYLSISSQILWIGSNVKQFNKAYNHILNLFDFIKNFGRQTYPVISQGSTLNNKEATFKSTELSLLCKDIMVSFEHKIIVKDLFWNIKFNSNKNNLYILKGKSGAGKSTILSVLSGQIKPDQGQVKVDGVDIYEVDDDVRKKLVCIQTQSGVAIRTTLRHNLIFGIPDEFQDQIQNIELINLLKNLEIWDIFSENGLESFIGENGVNLSGGQRQRLNFASLVIRSRYLKPSIILLDEPTSALDNQSEKLVLNQIFTLQKSHIVIMVSHKIDSILENNSNVIDISTLTKTSHV